MPEKASFAMEGRLAWPHSGSQGEQTGSVPGSLWRGNRWRMRGFRCQTKARGKSMGWSNRSGGRDDGTRNIRNILPGEGKMS